VIVFRYFFPEPARRESRRVAWMAMGAGAVLPGGNISSAAATGLLMRHQGVGTRPLLVRCGALLCLLTAVGFAANGIAGVLLLAGVPDGPLDLSHAGIPILVSVVVLSGAAIVVLASRHFAERMPLAVRGVAAGLEGAWDAVRNPTWRLLGAAGFFCLDMAALWAACAATGHRLGFLAVLIAYCIGYLATAVPMPAGIGVLDSGLAGALVLYGLPAPASVGAVLLYHAISIWVPGFGGLVAWLATRRAVTVRRPAIARAGLGWFQLAEAAENDGWSTTTRQYSEHRMRELLRAGSSAILIVLIMFIGSLVLWIGTPLLWLWVGSQIQGATASLGTALGAMMIGVVVTIAGIAALLSKLSNVYRASCVSRGHPDPGHFVLEGVLVVSAGITLAVFAVWFLFFAGASPVPIGIQI
jgi:uncharacterized membrane protein YbhN (UPF0104 family)